MFDDFSSGDKNVNIIDDVEISPEFDETNSEDKIYQNHTTDANIHHKTENVESETFVEDCDETEKKRIDVSFDFSALRQRLLKSENMSQSN